MKGIFMMSLNSKSSFLSPFGLTLCILSMLGTAYSLESRNEGKQVRPCVRDADCTNYYYFPAVAVCASYLPDSFSNKYCVDCNDDIIKAHNLDECKVALSYTSDGTRITIVDIAIIVILLAILLIIGGVITVAICLSAPCCPGHTWSLKREEQLGGEPNVAAYHDGYGKAAPSVTNSTAANNDVAANNAEP